MRKIIAALAIAVLSTSPAMAQTSAAARAQQLEKLEEDLNSPDPNLRLAAFEVAMESSSLAMRRKALQISLGSADVGLKSIAIRYYFCDNSTVVLRHAYDNNANVNFKGLQSGQRTIQIRNCDPIRGHFQTFVDREYLPEETMKLGSFTGSSVNFDYWLTIGAIGRGSCSVSLTLNDDNDFVGPMSCEFNGRSFGPVAALIVTG